MEIYLIRHTKLKVPNEVCYGQTNLETADTFQEEKEVVLSKIPSQLDIVFSSPLRRCHNLAQCLPAKKVITDPRIMELNFGNWEMKKWDEIDKAQLDPWMQDFVNVAPPGGESMLQMHSRVMDFWSELKSKNYEKVAVVSHSGAVRMILANEQGLPLTSIFEIKATYGSVFKILV